MTERAEIIVAYDRSTVVDSDGVRRGGVIGAQNRLPWQGALPGDMQHFVAMTLGRDVIVGRTTWESIPEKYRDLPGRMQKIVLSRTMDEQEGVVVARTMQEALARANDTPMVIGGSQVYEEALPYVDRIHATEIEVSVRGGDARFPIDLRHDDAWQEEPGTEVHFPNGRDKFIYSFVTYARRRRL